MTPRRLAALTLFLALSPAAPAAADSIAVVRDGNVWLVAPDGSAAHEVTSGGGWSSPTQSDAGVVAAVNDGRVHVMDQAGRPLAAPQSGARPVVRAAISPDGRLIAYEIVDFDDRNRPYPFVSYLATSGARAPDGPDGFATNPSWIGSERIVYTSAGKVSTQRPGGSSDEWWDDIDQYESFGDSFPANLDDAEVAPGRILIERERNGADGGARALRLYTFGAGDYVSDPSYVCGLGASADTSSVTFSADGNSFAWRADGAVKVAHLQNGHCPTSASTLVPGGDEPDWSPAPINPPKGPGGPGGGGGEVVFETAYPRRPKLKTTLRKGLPFKLSCPTDCVGVGVASVGRLTVAKGRVSVGAGGTGRLVLRFTRSARKKLARRKKVTVKVALAASTGSGETVEATTRVKLAR